MCLSLLSHKFSVLQTSMETSTEQCEAKVKSNCVLHNINHHEDNINFDCKTNGVIDDPIKTGRASY